ncbi:MAG: hypothetical protein OHK0010_32960 [Anaerolineales bacterium]
MTAIFEKADFEQVGTGAACPRKGILAESLRRKREREKQLEDYHNRPQVEAEGRRAVA